MRKTCSRLTAQPTLLVRGKELRHVCLSPALEVTPLLSRARAALHLSSHPHGESASFLTARVWLAEKHLTVRDAVNYMQGRTGLFGLC